MITHRLTIYPPTTNHLWRRVQTRRGPKTLLSEQARAFYRQGLKELSFNREVSRLAQSGGYQGAVSVHLEFYPSNRNRWDLDNRIKPVLDLLTKAGLFNDDSQVKKLTAIKHRYDTEHTGIVCIQVEDLEGC